MYFLSDAYKLVEQDLEGAVAGEHHYTAFLFGRAIGTATVVTGSGVVERHYHDLLPADRIPEHLHRPLKLLTDLGVYASLRSAGSVDDLVVENTYGGMVSRQAFSEYIRTVQRVTRMEKYRRPGAKIALSHKAA